MPKRRVPPSFDSPVKCVIVGDEGVGKTSLLRSYVDTTFTLEEDMPTMELTTYNASVDEESLQLVDTRGSEDYDRIRPLSYICADIFIICFADNDPVSMKNVETKWFPETQHLCPLSPCLLVGTKVDTRITKSGSTDDLDNVPISEGKELAKRIKAKKYLECSALTQVGVAEIFDEIARLAVASRQTENHTSFSCRCILF